MAPDPIDLNARRARARAEPLVLLVDDDPALLQLLARWLHGHRVRVLTAGDATEALEVLELEEGAAVVVSDYTMPGLDGISLLNQVEARWPLARRILYTGNADSELVLEAVRHKVLTKLMDPVLVRDAILRAARRPSPV